MPLYGADISTYQDGFDFAANRQACPFVVIKQTEGLSWPEQDDPGAHRLLHQMRDAAQDQGYVWVGLYHFARPQPGRTGTQEAEHFISMVGDLHPHEGVVLDYERNDRGLDKEALEQFAIDFVDRIEAQWPSLVGNVLFYTYPAFVAAMSTDRLVTRCPLYIAGYGPNDGAEHPSFVKLDRWSAYCLWQFSSNGTVAGWGSRVDVNRFEGTEDDLRALRVDNGAVVAPVPTPEPVPAPTPAPAPVFVPEGFPGEVLRRGSSGIHVVQVQQRLRNRGWSIEIDGEYGRATETVVKKFQAEKSLTADGIVGQKTWDAMYAFFEGLDHAPPPPPQPPTTLPPVPDPGTGAQHADPAGWCAAKGFDGNAGLNPVAEFQRAFAWWPIAVDGVAGPQTAVAVQKVVDEGDRLSAHFTIGELACHHCGRIRYLRATLETLELLRTDVGPIQVVSGYRCPVNNAAVGGAADSQHMMGSACDLNFPTANVLAARPSGYGTCGSDCLHLDRRDASGNNTTGASQSNPTHWYYC